MKSNPRQWIWRGIIGFIFLLVLFAVYGSQQTKVDRLNKQVDSLKAELNALKPGNKSNQTSPSYIGGPVYGDIQVKARNSKRTSDIKSLQTQIEAFYQNNGFYPSRADMNSPSWLTTNMKSLDQNSLADPLNPTGSTTLVASPTTNFYAYAPAQADGSSCEADDTTCSRYVLTATYEGTENGKKTIEVSNLDGS